MRRRFIRCCLAFLPVAGIIPLIPGKLQVRSRDISCNLKEDLRMISLARRLGIVLLVACSVAWSAYGPADGTISGTVRNSTGAPFQGAFVRARNVKTKTTVNVLSDKQGRFRVQNLPPGDYEIRGTAIGYKDDRSQWISLCRRVQCAGAT
ncbi:MAG: hypothetical protein DMG11_26675 [Acidobacteria bacterium]|nr:MAG: hypothetical protein DMG11_26675 [Acidobacteriota bacterium]